MEAAIAARHAERTQDRTQEKPEEQLELGIAKRTGDSGGNLQAVFDNPKEFLQVLREHHNQISGSSGFATMKDYFYTANHAADPRLRAAAEVVTNHYKDLASFGGISHSDRTGRPDGIDTLAIDRALMYLSGNYKPTLYWQEVKNVGRTALLGAMTVGLGALTAVSFEIPWLAAMTGIATATIGAYTGLSAYETYKYPSLMRAQSQEVQAKLRSWPEINRELRRS